MSGTVACAPAAALLLAAAALLLPGCGQPGATPGPSLFVCGGSWNLPPSFHGNPWAPGGEGAHRAFVFEPLFVFVPATGAYLPRLGLSYDLAPDRRSLTVRLRPGVLWHDGRAFTSADVVTTCRLGYLLGWPLWSRLRLRTVEAPDPLTLRFGWTCAATDRLLVDVLANAELCFPHHLYGQWDAEVPPLQEQEAALLATGVTSGPAYARESERLAVAKKAVRDQLFRLRPPLPTGTGPFALKRVTADVQRLVRFDRGWAAGQVAVDEVRIVRIPDNRMAWAALLGGELDASNASAPPEVAQRVLAVNPTARLGTVSDLQEFGFVFNTTRPPLSDLALRRAVAHVLDRDTITRISYPCSRPVVDYSTGLVASHRARWLDERFLAGLTRYDCSATRAETLLCAAGYRRDAAGPWRRPDGAALTLEILTVPNSDWVMGAEVAASQLTAFGIPTQVRIMPPDLVGMRLLDRDFDLAAEMGADFRRYALPAVAFERFYDRGGLMARATGVVDTVRRAEGEDASALVARLSGYLPEAEQRQLVERLARLTNEYLPFLPIYEKCLMVFQLEGVRVAGWPGKDDPLWSTASSGVEGFFASLLLEGRLRGVPR